MRLIIPVLKLEFEALQCDDPYLDASGKKSFGRYHVLVRKLSAKEGNVTDVPYFSSREREML